jgi:hypothetical protein
MVSLKASVPDVEVTRFFLSRTHEQNHHTFWKETVVRETMLSLPRSLLVLSNDYDWSSTFLLPNPFFLKEIKEVLWMKEGRDEEA